MKDFDFIAIGDIVTDAFIRIKQASVYDLPDDNVGELLCLVNGSKIPYESLTLAPAVGNSPNAAVSAARLGLSSALLTDMGSDDFAKENLDTLKRNGVAIDFVEMHNGRKSNYHFVLWHKAERTILIKHEDYDYVLPDIGNPSWVYFSSVGEDSLGYHHDIASYLREHTDVKLAFQPGTFQIKLGYEKLKDLKQHYGPAQ